MQHQCYGYNNFFLLGGGTYNLSTWQTEAGVYFHPVHLIKFPLPQLFLDPCPHPYSQCSLSLKQNKRHETIFRKQESKHQQKKIQQREMKQKKFICISQLLLLGMEPIWSVDIPTYTPLSIAIVSHLRVVETGKIWGIGGERI